MKTKPCILVVEDEEAMRTGLEYALRREGYSTVIVSDGDAALHALRAADGTRGNDVFSLVLLDVMIPKTSGFDVLKAIRAAHRLVPVILLTAKSQEADKVRGFDLGADDYVTKPFGLAELLARIRTRIAAATRADVVPDMLTFSDTVVDLRELTVSRNKEKHELSVKEADMLRLLWRSAGESVSRQRFLTEVWQHEKAPTTRTVDQHIVRLRQKIEADPAKPRHLITVFGIGYRLER